MRQPRLLEDRRVNGTEPGTARRESDVTVPGSIHIL